MDTKIITAHNERTQKMLASGIVIVDAAVEPLRVLKVLMEGLGADVKAGLWLTNFRGVPVARTLSPFDLVYLNADYHVVHCVEISTQGEYEPFRGDPASALVLPPKAIFTSKTRPGDKLQFRAVDEAAAQPSAAEVHSARPSPPPPQVAAEQPQPAHFFNSTFPVPSPQHVGTPLDQFLSARSGKSGAETRGAEARATRQATHEAAQNPPIPPPNPSGRLAKTARSVMGLSPTLRPATGGEATAPFYTGSVAAVVEHAPAHIEQRMSALAAPVDFVRPAPEAHPPVMTPSGRLRRGSNLAPEMAPVAMPQAEPIPPPVPEPSPIALAQAASPMLVPVQVPVQAPIPAPDPTLAPIPDTIPAPPGEATPKPGNGLVIPIKPTPMYAASAEAAAPERVPSLPTPEPMAPAAAAVAPPFSIAPAAEPAASLALAPVAKPSPPRPAAAFSQSAAAAAAIPQISQPPVRRSTAVQPNAIVASPSPVAAAQLASQRAAQRAITPVTSEQPVHPRTTELARTGPKAIEQAQKPKASWDVKLLYTLFPEFDPSRPTEIRIPRIEDKLSAEVEEDDRPSRKLQILCWLYPQLHLDQVKQKRSEERRAPRLPMPGLVAYFFTGGSPRPHPIKDISVTGFYMQTEERWLPGTIIRVTLQMVNAHSDGRDSVTVLSRVVRWGPDGGGFEFVLPGFMEA